MKGNEPCSSHFISCDESNLGLFVVVQIKLINAQKSESQYFENIFAHVQCVSHQIHLLQHC